MKITSKRIILANVINILILITLSYTTAFLGHIEHWCSNPTGGILILSAVIQIFLFVAMITIFVDEN